MEKHTVVMDGNIQSYYFINSSHLGIQILTQSQTKAQQDFWGETDMLILKFILECKGPRVVKPTLKNKNKI